MINACNNVLTKQGRIQGGPGGQKPTPSFGGIPKLYQEGKNVECMHVNGPHFSTSDVHPPYQNPVFTPVEILSRFGETSKFPQPSTSIIPSVGPSSFWCKWRFCDLAHTFRMELTNTALVAFEFCDSA